MTLYEINEAIMGLIDEDGEIADFEEFDELQLKREEKIENIALYIKNLTAEAKAIKDEEDVLKKRRVAAENKVQGLKCYLDHALQGEKFKTARTAISYSTSTQCVTGEEFIKWAQSNAAELLRFKDPEPNKTAIKELLKDGKEVPYAELRKVRNIVVR